MTRIHNPPHPGETLLEDVLPALGLTVTDAAGNSRELQVAPIPANDIPPEWYL